MTANTQTPDVSSVELVERLQDETTRLSGRSIDRGCADSGIASNLAAEAAALIEHQATELSRMREVLDDLLASLDPLIGRESVLPGFNECRRRARQALSPLGDV